MDIKELTQTRHEVMERGVVIHEQGDFKLEARLLRWIQISLYLRTRLWRMVEFNSVVHGIL